jgi:hypothetical protein
MQTTDTQVYVTEVSVFSFVQAAFHTFYSRYKDLACPYSLPLAENYAVCTVSNQLVDRP